MTPGQDNNPKPGPEREKKADKNNLSAVEHLSASEALAVIDNALANDTQWLAGIIADGPSKEEKELVERLCERVPGFAAKFKAMEEAAQRMSEYWKARQGASFCE